MVEEPLNIKINAYKEGENKMTKIVENIKELFNLYEIKYITRDIEVLKKLIEDWKLTDPTMKIKEIEDIHGVFLGRAYLMERKIELNITFLENDFNYNKTLMHERFHFLLYDLGFSNQVYGNEELIGKLVSFCNIWDYEGRIA